MPRTPVDRLEVAAVRKAIEELERRGLSERAQAVRDGKCGCPCMKALTKRNSRTVYLNERHKQRAHRERVQNAATAAGLPSSLTLSAIEATTSPHDRNGDAQTPKRTRQSKPRDGVSLYLPTLTEAEAALRDLTALGWHERPIGVALAAGITRRRKRTPKGTA